MQADGLGQCRQAYGSGSRAPAAYSQASNVRCTLGCVPYRWLPQALALLVGIEAYEVLQVLSASRRIPVPAVAGGVPVLTIWGRTDKGRPLIVAVRMVDQFDQGMVLKPAVKYQHIAQTSGVPRDNH